MHIDDLENPTHFSYFSVGENVGFFTFS